MNTRRNFLKKSTTLTVSSLLPTNILSAILPTELPIPNFNGFLNANFIFHGDFDFTEIDSHIDIFKGIRSIIKFKNLQKKCFVLNPRILLSFYRSASGIKFSDPQLNYLGINLEDFYKIKSYYDKNAEINGNVQFLPFEKWDEFESFPEYKNCEVEIPFEKMARILGKDDSLSPLEFFSFNGSPEWHDYFDVFLESKGIENFKNQTSKSLENIRFNIGWWTTFAGEDIKFLQKVNTILQSNQQVATHCPEVMSQINHLIKVIHVHVEDHKISLQEKHFNQSNQDPDWYFDNTDIFANTKERFYE